MRAIPLVAVLALPYTCVFQPDVRVATWFAFHFRQFCLNFDFLVAGLHLSRLPSFENGYINHPLLHTNLKIKAGLSNNSLLPGFENIVRRTKARRHEEWSPKGGTPAFTWRLEYVYIHQAVKNVTARPNTLSRSDHAWVKKLIRPLADGCAATTYDSPNRWPCICIVTDNVVQISVLPK